MREKEKERDRDREEAAGEEGVKVRWWRCGKVKVGR